MNYSMTTPPVVALDLLPMARVVVFLFFDATLILLFKTLEFSIDTPPVFAVDLFPIARVVVFLFF